MPYDTHISSEKKIKLARASPEWKGQTMYTYESNSTDANFINHNYQKFPQSEFSEGELGSHGKTIQYFKLITFANPGYVNLTISKMPATTYIETSKKDCVQCLSLYHYY
jgi:hypothetical protein